MVSELRGASDQTADVRVGIGMGAWKTVITQKADVIGKRSFSQDGQQWTVMFYKPTAGASADTTQVRLKHTVRDDRLNVRLVATDSEGKERVPGTWRGQSKNGFANDTAIFQDLPLSSIKEFRFQVRPYNWVEFKNARLARMRSSTSPGGTTAGLGWKWRGPFPLGPRLQPECLISGG